MKTHGATAALLHSFLALELEKEWLSSRLIYPQKRTPSFNSLGCFLRPRAGLDMMEKGKPPFWLPGIKPSKNVSSNVHAIQGATQQFPKFECRSFTSYRNLV
jgi:hypothetical protein